MANVDRTRSEVLRRRVYRTTGADVINAGDQLVKSSGAVRPSSAIATADLIADAFAGIAIEAKPAGSQPEIMVGIDCIAEMDLATPVSGAVVDPGTLVEPVIVSNLGVPQSVVVGSGNPIGKVSKIGRIGDVTLTCHFVGVDAVSPVVAD